MSRVSILLPCRDAARHLPAAVASLRGQTLDDFEVLAVDDGSRDATAEVLGEWARQDPRVRVLRGHGRGIVPALATALAAARGELVARMDADDLAHPRRLERQVALLDAEPRVAACGTRIEYFPARLVREGGRRYQAWINGLITEEEIARDIFVECPLPHPTLMIRRSVLLGVGGYRDLGWPEDYDLVLRLWEAGHRMRKVPHVLHRWREGEERLSRTDPRYAPTAFLRLKVHFLTRTLLAGGRPAVIWGAGPVGKTLARALLDAGTPVAAFVEVDPRKIGQEIHGAPVVSEEEIRGVTGGERAGRAGALVLAAVGQPGAREEIRAACRARGLHEGADFVAVA